MCRSGSGSDDERVRERQGGREQCTINEYERERDEENCREKSDTKWLAMNSGVVVQWDDCATSSRVVVVSDMFFSLMFSSLASPSSLDEMGWVLCTSRQPTATALRQHIRVGGAWEKWLGVRWAGECAEGRENEEQALPDIKIRTHRDTPSRRSSSPTSCISRGARRVPAPSAPDYVRDAPGARGRRGAGSCARVPGLPERPLRRTTTWVCRLAWDSKQDMNTKKGSSPARVSVGAEVCDESG